MYAIERTPLSSPAAQALIAALNAELGAAYPEPGATHWTLSAEETDGARGAFLVATRDGTAIGCGAVRLIDADTAELKRMYVAPAARGTGIGKRLVAALEAEAARIGAKRVVLETGVRQEAALGLYARCGYARIPLYGEYVHSPATSVCLGRTL
ncbi:MAG TPA: GNAT family N-acetyltransferase [Gemmatimonadaceae bacterium]|nr:GNAT family N-acetyltransferase [Gemmatimonadaceae bacterium]